ncbi:hypothetical protein EL832_15605 [Salmonella enterica subsp. enterica serovar Hvittingfoss]|nr:hypothetical protein [Salmonella enterica subsp. enterica serovar Hvittingfoss]
MQNNHKIEPVTLFVSLIMGSYPVRPCMIIQALGDVINAGVNAKIFVRFGGADDFLDSQEINNVYRSRTAPRN